MNRRYFAVLGCFGMLASAFAGNDYVTVVVSNGASAGMERKMIEIPVSDLFGKIPGNPKGFVVKDPRGVEIPSQLTSDSLLIFQASVGAGETAGYTIAGCDSVREYEPLVAGRVYPERADDVAWENEIVGFRAYGPATQKKGERAFGYDLFFKYSDKGLVLEKLYGPETSPATWAKVDSLRAIDWKLADDYIESFSYHVDHGIGMDCFPVGATLGAGASAPIVGDSISFSWCHARAEVLDNGPLRFTVRLDYAPRSIGEDTDVTEHRVITLDAGSRMNRTSLSFENQKHPLKIGAGFPIRDDKPTYAETDSLNIIAYSHPVQREEYGRAFLGVVAPGCDADTLSKEGHLLLTRELAPGQTHEYWWGFKWEKNQDGDFGAWVEAVKADIREKGETLKITID